MSKRKLPEGEHRVILRITVDDDTLMRLGQAMYGVKKLKVSQFKTWCLNIVQNELDDFAEAIGEE